MSTLLFIPPATYVTSLKLRRPLTLRQLCKNAEVPCKASGDWTERKIEIANGDELRVFAEPGDWGNVRIESQESDKKKKAQLALAVLAYGLHDLVSKESIHGNQLFRPGAPKGRPKKERALTTKERQRRFRAKQKTIGSRSH